MKDCPVIPGRIVHYKLAESVIRPALVIEVHESEACDLMVLLNGKRDVKHVGCRIKCAEGHIRLEEIQKGAGVGEWQWPPRVSPPKPDIDYNALAVALIQECVKQDMPININVPSSDELREGLEKSVVNSH